MAQFDWNEEAFFESVEPDSLDGGTTSQGALWHAISPRWGHSMHSMCSYHGMFPPRLVHYFIQRFSVPGDLVLDPFSGRGTTALQARVEGRKSISNDLNPLAYVLTRAKADPPSWADMDAYLAGLEGAYRGSHYRDVDVPADIQMLFHDNTLRQLTFLRDRLLSKPMLSWSREDLMLAGAVAGVLHGAHRSDGSSGYLSISMPNTFSMAPAYVRKYIRDNDLSQPDQDVFDCVRDKIARLYADSLEGERGRVSKRDACRLLQSRSRQAQEVDLVITSPPYLRVVNYGTANWIRLWWLGLEDVSRNAGVGRRALDAKLDHRHNYDSYLTFLHLTLLCTRSVLRPGGVAVFVVGDVTNPRGESLALAQQIWSDIGDQTGLRLLELIEDSLPAQKKVSRIWGETKGKATDRDCVLVLTRDDGAPTTDMPDVAWEEPYRDGGPDAAHERLRRRRKTSSTSVKR